MCVHDLEGNLLFVNTAAAKTLGFRPEDGIGWNLRRFLSSAVEDQFDAYLERIRTNGMDTGRMSLLSKEGGDRIWLYRNVLYHPGCRPRPRSCPGRDQRAPTGPQGERWRPGPRGHHLVSSGCPTRAARTFVNQPWLTSPDGRREQLGEGDREPTLTIVRGSSTRTDAVIARPSREYRLRRVDGDYHWMIGYAVPRIEEDGTFAGLVGSCVDGTEERRTRDVLEVSRTRRIESLGVLAGGIAHEFNNLLTVIGGRIQLLLDRLSADEPACHDLHLIQRSAQRAAALTQQLLAGRRQLLRPRRPHEFAGSRR
jgi:PAS domain-containing protein